MKRIETLIFGVLFVASLSTCMGVARGQAAAKAGASSAEDLMKQVLAALETKDQQALQQLAVTPAEFKRYLWPTMASTVGADINAEKFYGMYSKASEIGLAERLAELGGKKYELVTVSFDPQAKQTKSARVLRTAHAVIRDGNGQEKTVRLVGAVLE